MIEAPQVGVDQADLEWQASRFNRCVVNPIEWFKYVRIKDATTQSIVSFQMWKHLNLILLLLPRYQQIALLKAKQIGCSWLMAGYHLWRCYRPATNILCFSRGQTEAGELLDKSRFINANLPNWLQLKVGHDGAEYMSFPDTDSRIRALPSTVAAGVGETATHVTRDELDFHDYAEENFAHVKPTVDAGASIMDMTTSLKSKPQSHFKGIYRRAKLKENNYYPLFLPWYVRPGRNWEWYNRVKRDYPIEYLFYGDYPTTEEDALAPIEGLGLFEKSALERLIAGCGSPVRTPGTATYIFHPYEPENRYYAGGDAAEGRGGDYSVLWIEGTNGVKRWLAAVIHTNQMTTDIFAQACCELLRAYNRPTLVMGSDAWGEMVLKDIAEMGFRDCIYSSEQNTKKGKLGFQETEANKQQTLANFSYAVRDGLIVEYRPAVDEMFGWNVNNGKYESNMPHDDLVIAGSKANVAHDMADFGLMVTGESYF